MSMQSWAGLKVFESIKLLQLIIGTLNTKGKTSKGADYSNSSLICAYNYNNKPLNSKYIWVQPKNTVLCHF